MSPTPPPLPSTPHDRVGMALLGCLLVVGVALIVLAGLATAYVVRTRRAGAPRPVPSVPAAQPASSSASEGDAPAIETTAPDADPAPLSHSWTANPGIPLLMDVNGDGVEDLIGRVVVRRARGEIEIAAYDGATYARLWSVGAFGDVPWAARDVALVAGHGFVAAMDGKARFALVDARTGAVVLRGEAEEAGLQGCATTGGTPKLWLGTKRGIGVVFDVLARQATPRARPAACTTAKARPWGVPTAAPASLPWDAGGILKNVTLREGPIRFTFGINNWTKKILMVAGFGASSSEPLWRRPLREGAGEAPPVSYDVPADLVEGKAYVVYPIRIDAHPFFSWRMQALDALDGREIWDVALVAPGSSNGSWPPTLSMTETRVYVAFDQWLEIYARETGVRLARIGP